MSNIKDSFPQPDKIKKAKSDGPFLMGFPVQRQNKETGVEENIEYQFNETHHFKGPVHKDNWMDFYSFLYTHLIKPEYESDCSNLFECLRMIEKDIVTIKRIKFKNSLIKASKELLLNLPPLIEKALLKDPLIKSEVKIRGTPTYGNINNPSYLEEDDFDYNYGGTWLEQIIQTNFYDDFKATLVNKINKLESWNQSEQDNGNFPSKIGKRNVDTLAINKLIGLASKLFRDRATGLIKWPLVADLLASVFHSELTDKAYKDLIKSEQLLYEPKDYGTELHDALIDKIKKRAPK